MKNLKNTILQGDALSVLKTLPNDFVDLGITSPPYNKKEKQKGWLVKNVLYHASSDKLPEADYQKQQIEVLNELYRITKTGGSFFYNHKIRWEKGELLHPFLWLNKTNWAIKQEIIWDRMIAANIRGWRFWQVEERIYWLYKPINNNKIGEELKSKHALLTSIWRFSPERDNPHPAPFPIKLPTRIIYSILDKKTHKTIIDPYAGSGTTLVASKLLNHNFIGIEIAEPYIDYANKRLHNAEDERLKIDKEINLHKVNKTFKERKAEGKFVGKFKKNVEKKIISKQNNLF
ncbi:MAG: site-specific DNA-methyltransferase [Bacteroidetes bacterium 4572_128]|nr:MAG: site-specific DNA-methyltransferase [Bacteroidetes bacterium 4572_128]